MKKILIIDDETEIRNIFQEILECEGFSVITAANSNKGMECLKADSFHLIIIDKKMPSCSGPEFIRTAAPHLGSARVLLVSGSPSNTTCEGISGFLPKPCDIDTLVKAVRDLIDS